jgi:hypothetical protein
MSDLAKQIEELKLLVSTQEENYKTALEMHAPLELLKQMRENMKKLKADLQILLQKVQKLPDNSEYQDILPAGRVYQCFLSLLRFSLLFSLRCRDAD